MASGGCEPRKSFLTPCIFIPLLSLADGHRCGAGLGSKLSMVGMYKENFKKLIFSFQVEMKLIRDYCRNR